MRPKLLAVGLGLSLCISLAAQTPLYRPAARFALGGDDFWDYMTYDSGGNRLFVAHGSAITVVDTATGKEIGSVPANGAHGIALVPDRGLGFSSNGRAGTVTVFDLKSLKPQAEIKAGENPDAIIYDPYSKQVIVMNGRSQDLMAIDPGALKVVATVPLGGKLEFAAAARDHVYVNVEDTAEIAVVDSKTWKLEERWKLEGCEEPSGLAIDSQGGRLFTVCGNKRMLVVDTKTGQILASLPTGAGTDAAAFDPGLRFAFASNGDGTLTIVRQTPNGKYEVAENITTQPGARTMALDPNSHRVFTVTAEFGPPVAGQRRPSFKAGTFTLLVYEPVK
jgi:DNA-binding beta-propeller fold protein YncE